MRKAQELPIKVLVITAIAVFVLGGLSIVFYSTGIAKGSTAFNDQWDSNSCIDLKTNCNVQKAQERGCDWAQGGREEATNQCPSGVSPVNDVSGSSSNPASGELASFTNVQVGGLEGRTELNPSANVDISSEEAVYLHLLVNRGSGLEAENSKECSGESCSMDQTISGLDDSEVVGIGFYLSSSEQLFSDGSLDQGKADAKITTAYKWVEGDNKWEPAE